jgi:hypothetical protein
MIDLELWSLERCCVRLVFSQKKKDQTVRAAEVIHIYYVMFLNIPYDVIYVYIYLYLYNIYIYMYYYCQYHYYFCFFQLIQIYPDANEGLLSRVSTGLTLQALGASVLRLVSYIPGGVLCFLLASQHGGFKSQEGSMECNGM